MRAFVRYKVITCEHCQASTEKESDVFFGNNEQEIREAFTLEHGNQIIIRVIRLIDNCIWCDTPINEKLDQCGCEKSKLYPHSQPR